MVSVRSKTIDRVTAGEVEMLARLTLPGGSMGPALRRSKRRGTSARVVMLRVDHVVVSWALVRPGETYMFTHPNHRRKGYGAQVLNHVQRFDPNVQVCPHDEVSRAFFTAMGRPATARHYSY